jgi:hypothetical protein
MILSHKYIRIYISLITKALSRNIELLNTYTEKHHIFPISIFGENKKTAVLTAREHFIAHRLLYKIYYYRYGHNHKYTIFMLKAITLMSSRKEIKNNSRMYEKCRKAASLAMSGNNNPSIKYGFSEQHRRKISQIQKGKPHSKQHKQNLKLASIKRKVRGDIFFSEAAREKSLKIRLAAAKRYDYINISNGILEYNLTLKQLVDKYPEDKLNTSNIRKTKKNNLTSKNWKIIKEY